MGSTAGKCLGKKSESNRKRRYPGLRFSPSSRKREEHKRHPKGEVGKNATPPRSHTAICDLPLEILDMILQKSYLHWILKSPMRQRDEDVIRSLISVDVCFNQRITRRRFKKEIWRFWRDFYGKNTKRSAIIRNNRNYFEENIQPSDELIASLLSLNCITQEQSHFIQRHHSTQDKNSELVFILESFDETRFSNFVKCLRQNKQQTVARIMENGGGGIKIELQSRGAKCTASMESQLLHKKFEDLRNETKSWSHKTYKLNSQLKDEGLVILNSLLDRWTVVVWIWCRSQAALEYIQKMYESNQLRDVFFENIQMPISTVINIDRNQFKNTIVVCPFSVSFTQRIKVQENEGAYAYRMTKLRSEICILFQPSSQPSSRGRFLTPVIHAFKDQHPFHWQKKIELTGITLPYDVASDERENCLYIIQYTRRRSVFWKVTREGDDIHKIIKWLIIDHLPQYLTVTTDGRFLIYNSSLSSLLIYGSDAELIRSVHLPTYIKFPLHAVETSIGNLIIIHLIWIQDQGVNGAEMVMKWGISQLARDGQKVIRRFIPSNETQQLNSPECISIDSEDRVFVADSGNDRVILLDSDLRWNRILISTKEKEEAWIRRPNRLYYDEEKKQLIVGGNQVNIYSISRK